MNLKSRIGDLLQGRHSGNGPSAPDSEAAARERQHQQDEAQRLYMKRLNAVRNRELDDLRAVMRRRAERRSGKASSSSVKRNSSSGVTRPPGLAEGSQMVSLINELEIKVLSEPMGLMAVPGGPPSTPVTSGLTEPIRTTGLKPFPTNPLDDAALMMAAQRWDQAGDLLLSAIHAGGIDKGIDWVARCAIDLLERGGQNRRAAEVRQQYLEKKGQAPERIVPAKLSAPVAGRVHAGDISSWRCASRLGADDAVHLQSVLQSAGAGTVVVVDWSDITALDALAAEPMQRVIQMAMRSRTVFVQIGLSRLVRAVRLELQAQSLSETTWNFWLVLMNWNGFRNAHRAASIAFLKRFQYDPPAYLSSRCICHSLNKPLSATGHEFVSSARFLGDLSREHAQELEALEVPAAQPGAIVLLDCRFLTSLDFFFGADLLNWVIRRHTRGEVVSIAFAHPLLAHFLQMLGLHDYAKLHRLPPPHKS
jgi:hypothetical protein